MKARKEGDGDKKDLVEEFVRDKARQSALKLIEEISQKAAQDVDARLKYLAPEAPGYDGEMAPAFRCGRTEGKDDQFSKGIEEVFQRYYKLGMGALNRADAGTAAFYLGKCLLLPVSDELKMKQMVRHNLRLALSLRDRMKAASRNSDDR